MYVPFLSSRSSESAFNRRAGGGSGGGGGGGSSGGGARGGSSGGSSGGGSRGGSSGGGSSGGGRGGSTGGGSSGGGTRGGSSGGGSTGSNSGARSVPIGSGSNTGGRTTATAYGTGGGKPSTIPSGSSFAGRSQGGGTRNQVFGSRTYGSGYPGVSSRGVRGLGFPFYFWPVVWGSTAGAGGAAYLHDSEYGDPNNSSRPGGALYTIPFSSSSGNTTFHIVADNATTTSLLSSITSNCSSFLASNSSGSQFVIPIPSSSSSNDTNSSIPEPEQAVQYYRASSIVLTLDGYNDTVALNATAGVNDTHTPLPGWIDSNLLNCMNQTIGLAAPLVDAEDSSTTSEPFTTSSSISELAVPFRSGETVGLLWLLVIFFKTLF